jgi:hypothetical protein
VGPLRATPVNREGCDGAACTKRSDQPTAQASLMASADTPVRASKAFVFISVGVHAVPFQCSKRLKLSAPPTTVLHQVADCPNVIR